MRFKYIFSVSLLIFLASCGFGEPSITIVLESIAPYNTSKTPIYMMGNFNEWNPKDENYRLNWLGGEKFGLKLEISESFADSVIEYKYTRGSLENVEVAKDGTDIRNRKLPYLKKSLTALDQIGSWEKIELDSNTSSILETYERK
ncbi:MAG: hypothetical protein ACJAWV_001837 [Flammeovirgaceae bacterium]|jgi:hypothetical protein